MRKFFRFLFLYRNWRTIEKCAEIVNNKKSPQAMAIWEEMSMEEIEAVADIEAISRILTGGNRTDRKQFKKDFAHLRKVLGV